MAQARTVRELRKSGYRSRSVKQELRDNLIARLQRGEPIFPGIVGYEESVIPQIENAILSGQDIVFLGERGQAKTRMARLLVELLDEEIPALAGSRDQRRSPGPRSRRPAAPSWPSAVTTRPSRGWRATAATARSWPRPTSPSPTSSARSTPSRWPRGATCPTS